MIICVAFLLLISSRVNYELRLKSVALLLQWLYYAWIEWYDAKVLSHIIFSRECVLFVRWTTRYNIQTNNANTQTICWRIYSIQSPRSTLMADGCESNPRSAFGEDEESSHLKMKEAIGYLSKRLTINDWRRLLRAFGKTNVEIESIMLKYYHYSTSDMIHAYLSRWSEYYPYANLRKLIKTLRKSELNL